MMNIYGAGDETLMVTHWDTELSHCSNIMATLFIHEMALMLSCDVDNDETIYFQMSLIPLLNLGFTIVLDSHKAFSRGQTKEKHKKSWHS